VEVDRLVKFAHFRRGPKIGIFDHITPNISSQDCILKNRYGEGKYIPPRDPQLNFCPDWSSSLPWRGAAKRSEAPLFLMRYHLYKNGPIDLVMGLFPS
jgi:hypothetical protein